MTTDSDRGFFSTSGGRFDRKGRAPLPPPRPPAKHLSQADAEITSLFPLATQVRFHHIKRLQAELQILSGAIEGSKGSSLLMGGVLSRDVVRNEGQLIASIIRAYKFDVVPIGDDYEISW